MEIISRQAAHERGLTHFFTGKKCRRGHLRERNVKTGACLDCLAHYARQYATKYRDEKLGFVSVSVQVHPDDVDTLRRFGDLLRRARIAGTPVPMVPDEAHVATVNTMISMLQPATQAPPAVVDEVAGRHAMWVRIHGQEIADQMLENERAQG